MSNHGYNWYFGKVIAYLRKRRSINQADFAQRIGLKRGALSRVENGFKDIKVTDLSKFAIALDLTSIQLYQIVINAFARRNPKRDETELLLDLEQTCNDLLD